MSSLELLAARVTAFWRNLVSERRKDKKNEEAWLCSRPPSGCLWGQRVPALVQFGCMSPQFLLVWVSLSWISSHWNQVSYLNKHTHIVLKERKLGEGYLFRILLFYLLKGKYWTLPCPHLILPAVDLARDGGPCPLSLRCLSPHHAHSSGRSQDVCPDAVGA